MSFCVLVNGASCLIASTSQIDPQQPVDLLQSRRSTDHINWRSQRVARKPRTTRNDPSLMVWTPPFSTGIEVPKWRCKPTTYERERHHEDYDHWDRFGKNGVSSAWGRPAWERGYASSSSARTW